MVVSKPVPPESRRTQDGAGPAAATRADTQSKTVEPTFPATASTPASTNPQPAPTPAPEAAPTQPNPEPTPASEATLTQPNPEPDPAPAQSNPEPEAAPAPPQADPDPVPGQARVESEPASEAVGPAAVARPPGAHRKDTRAKTRRGLLGLGVVLAIAAVLTVVLVLTIPFVQYYKVVPPDTLAGRSRTPGQPTAAAFLKQSADLLHKSGRDGLVTPFAAVYGDIDAPGGRLTLFGENGRVLSDTLLDRSDSALFAYLGKTKGKPDVIDVSPTPGSAWCANADTTFTVCFWHAAGAQVEVSFMGDGAATARAELPAIIRAVVHTANHR